MLTDHEKCGVREQISLDLHTERERELIILSPPVKLLDDVSNISPEANMLFQLFSSMAENETYLRVRRVTRGKEKKKAEGKLSSGKPIFGYTVNKDP